MTLRFAWCALLFALLWLPAPVAAQVVATFYSQDFGDSFPHAFFTVRGRLVAGGADIDTNYGFTAKAISPAILFGPVGGKVEAVKPAYIARSDVRFSVTLSDAHYAALMAVVEKWRTRPSPSYDLNKANCVHFVGEAAQAIGLTVTFPKKLMKKPRSYLTEIVRLNPTLAASAPLDRKMREARRAPPR